MATIRLSADNAEKKRVELSKSLREYLRRLEINEEYELCTDVRDTITWLDWLDGSDPNFSDEMFNFLMSEAVIEECYMQGDEYYARFKLLGVRFPFDLEDWGEFSEVRDIYYTRNQEINYSNNGQ